MVAPLYNMFSWPVHVCNVDVGDALQVEARYRISDEPREIFFFREGSVVFWNVPEVEVRNVHSDDIHVH